METLTFPGRKTGKFLQMGIGKKLDGFGSESRDIKCFILNKTISKAGYWKAKIPFQSKK